MCVAFAIVAGCAGSTTGTTKKTTSQESVVGDELIGKMCGLTDIQYRSYSSTDEVGIKGIISPASATPIQNVTLYVHFKDSYQQNAGVRSVTFATLNKPTPFLVTIPSVLVNKDGSNEYYITVGESENTGLEKYCKTI